MKLFLLLTLASVCLANNQKEFIRCTYSPSGLLFASFDCSALETNIDHSDIFNNFETYYTEYVNDDCSAYQDQMKYFAFRFNFENCVIPRIPDKFFYQLENTEEIYLDFAGVETIDGEHSFVSNSLKNLSMTNNNLTSLPANLFWHTPAIRSIDFSYNQISEVDPRVFNGVTDRLDKINLSHNQIETLDDSLFTDLLNLSQLNLANNFIYSFTPDLSNLNNLKHLILRNNKISQLNCNFYPNFIPREALFDVSRNELREIDFSCNKICEMPTSGCIVLNIEDNHLNNLTLPATNLANSLDSVLAYKNEIENIYIESDLDNLKYFYLSKNRLTNADDIFEHCNLLRILELSHNKIRRINTDSFTKMTQLELLYLNNISLVEIDLNVISQSTNLVVLDLSCNNMKKINFEPNFQKLQQFSLNDNQFKELTNWDYSKFPKLILFNIINNRFNCTYLEQILRPLNFSKIHLESNSQVSTKNVYGITCQDEDVNIHIIHFDWDNYEIEALLHSIVYLLLFLCIVLLVFVFVRALNKSIKKENDEVAIIDKIPGELNKNKI